MTNGSDFRSQASAKMNALEGILAPLFDKLPHLPEDARKSIVGIAPWLALVAGVLGLYSTWYAYQMLAAVSALAYMGGMMGGTWYPASLIAVIALGIGSVIDLLAYKPLTSHSKQGWNLLFYGNTLTAVSAILNLIFGYYGSFSWIIGVVIGYWVLFEIRSAYKA